MAHWEELALDVRRGPSAAMRRPLLTALVVMLLALPGCAREVKYRSLEVGQCLPASAKIVGRREAAPPIVECLSPHLYQVYDVSNLPKGPFPGVDELDHMAKQACVSTFESALGVDANALPDGVDLLYLAPTESSWKSEKDRQVECLVVFETERTGRFGRGGDL